MANIKWSAFNATASPIATTDVLVGLVAGVTGTNAQIRPVDVANAMLSANLSLGGIITPAQLLANTNDWAPTGLAAASTIRVSSDAAYNITGLLAASIDGTMILLVNVGTFTLTLKTNSGSSAAANRFSLLNDISLTPNAGVWLRYDATQTKWRAMAANLIPGTDVQAYSANLAVLATAPAAGAVPVGNAGGTAPAYVAISGDATLASTGALTIANNAITTAKIAGNAVTLAKLATQADQTILGNVSGGAAVPVALTQAQVITFLGSIAASSALDGTFAINNTADNTKQFKWSLAGQTTGTVLTLATLTTTTRTIQIPNITATDTIAVLGLAQTYTGARTISAAISANLAIAGSTGSEIYGLNAGNASMTGANVTIVGNGAGLAATSTANSTFIGKGAGAAKTSGDFCTFVGSSCGSAWTTVANLTAMGYQALQGAGALSGTQNTAFGYQAAKVISTGSKNVAIGYQALAAENTGSSNVAVGNLALSGNNGSGNIAIGDGALGQAFGAGSNTAIGNSALNANGNAADNTAVGAGALQSTTGATNTAFGSGAGNSNVSGTQNIFIGRNAGSNSTNSTSNKCIIGSDAAPATDVWFGKGDLSATATAYTIHGTDGLGTDKVGSDLIHAAGRGTGAGTAGTLIFKTAVAAGSSATLQTLTTAMTILATASHDVRLDTGDLIVNAVGKGVTIKEGSNAKMGVATLVLGTVVVSTTAVTANSRIQLTRQSLGTITVPPGLAVSARTGGTSFTILSGDLTDTSTVSWIIFEPS